MIAKENLKSFEKMVEKSHRTLSKETSRCAEELGRYGFRGKIAVTVTVELDPDGSGGNPDAGVTLERTTRVRFNRD